MSLRKYTNKLLIIGILLLGGRTFGEIGDVWDAKAHWSDVSNPNVRTSPPYGTWSYRLSNGDLMVKAFGDCGGSPGDWSSSLGGCPNLFNNNWAPGGSHYSSEFAGHGPWMVQWKSPINGYIELRGSLWQKFDTSRRMAYYLILNGDEILAYDFIPQDIYGNTIIGRLGTISFDSIFCSVSVDDTIDLIVDGSGPGGSGTPTFAVATFNIEQIEEPPIPLPPALITGDIDRNNCVDFNDLAMLSNRWLDQDCSYPRWCEGADIDESNDVDFLDLAFIGNNWNQCYIEPLHNLGFLIISPGGPWDGGDFGPSTPGTTTSGFQEAFNSGVNQGKDIFIIGGGSEEPFGASGPVVYFMDSILNIPPAENWRVIGGDYVINFNYSSGDCIVFDSQKNSEFKLGLIVAPGIENGSLIKIKPHMKRPDNQKAFSNNILTINAPVGGGDVFGGGVDGKGIGLHLDASEGPIENNKIFCQEPIACDTGVLLEAGDITNNSITCSFLHICNNSLVVNSGIYNKFDILLEGNGVLNPPIGANISGGEQNTFNLIFAGGYGSGNSLVFGPNTKDNLVYATNLPINGIANNSLVPTNRIITRQPVGFNVTTPAFPDSEDDLQNRSSYTVVATITSEGVVSSWTLTDADGQSQTVNAGLYIGQLIYLEPGEKVNFTYIGSPSWKWRALR